MWRPWAHLLFGNWLMELARLAAARDAGVAERRALG
jgi:hypothetical protein